MFENYDILGKHRRQEENMRRAQGGCETTVVFIRRSVGFLMPQRQQDGR